jgi:hypothetical protein
MTTGPLRWLETGTIIDGEWEVQDTFRIKPSLEKIVVLQRLVDGVQRYLNIAELKRMFMGDRVR